MDTTLVAIIILAVLGTGILWIMKSSDGSFGWRIKTSLFDISTRAKGPKGPVIEQIQNEGKGNTQIASGKVSSRQTQTGGKNNLQKPENS